MSSLDELRKMLENKGNSKEVYLNLVAFGIASLGGDYKTFNQFRYWLLPSYNLTYVKPYPYYKPFHLAIVNYSSCLAYMLDATGRFAWGLTLDEQEEVVKLLEKHYGYNRT